MSEEGKWGMVIKMMVMQRTSLDIDIVFGVRTIGHRPGPITNYPSQVTIDINWNQIE